MLHVECHGSPYEIGHQHGSAAKDQVEHSIEFYKSLFQTTAGLSWDEACDVAVKFLPFLESREEWKDLVNEMEGIADAASQSFPSILALNTRTEIAYGMRKPGSSDGCSALSWHTDNSSVLAQNWDWREAQAAALISLRIHSVSELPSIHMITEGGIVGKIGLSSSGVGVCLNAIRHPGVSFTALPVHLALRSALQCGDAKEATVKLQDAGVASACHILVADRSLAVGLECSASAPVRRLEMDAGGTVLHTNHYILPVPGETERAQSQPSGASHVNGHAASPAQSQHSNGKANGASTKDLDLPDSVPRLQRLKMLVQELRDTYGASKGHFSPAAAVERLFEDEDGAPGAICRFPTGEGKTRTLFGVVMDLRAKKGWVKVGRPIELGEKVLLDPSASTAP